MSSTHSFPASSTPRWVWLTLGLIILLTLLVVFALPSARNDDEVGERGPGVRPQSDVGPPPPPSVARTRTLAA
ncbi:hypothetical protein TBR22_A10670 [Luteitalea sp. TBR-22]|uniref:hypothetical protein n=1 Tax=Luteitalea sp. TBR-22 TaxID=2802971 RepID=UPI001AFA14F0|nr:hypothetical protein [Luteitalea sp. TBR-22]BCS31864.1 hypothetical protein TBR22_A10670 [Luteitalea sp. TBR-22]